MQNNIRVEGVWGRVFVLTPGVIDNQAKGAFTQGQCHALALALHEATGWPLRGMYSSPYIKDVEEDTPNHCVVESPDGLVDIEGLGVERRLDGWDNVLPINKEDVLDFENRDYVTPNMEAAKLFC